MTTAEAPTKNINTTHTRAKTMSFFSWLLSVEGVLRACEITAVVAGVFAVAALIGKDVANRVLRDRRAVEMLTMQKQVADAQRESADSQRRLLEVQNRLAWRRFDEYAFREILESRAKGRAEIVYKKDDDEAYVFAFQIWHSLAASNWSAEMPVEAKDNPESSVPFSLREGGMVGTNQPSLFVLVGSNDELAAKPYDRDTPVDALMKAFNAVGFPPMISIPHEGIRPPAGTIRIVVGPRL
jgi:hypothetical protein